jgi:hypothetical protein
MDDISQDEILTRFIFSSRHFSRRNETVKFGAFMPPQVSKDPPLYNQDLSVYRLSGLLDNEKWTIGWEYVQTESRSIKARADVPAQEVYKSRLDVVSDVKPHERHANITPFPPDRLGCQKLATKLARASKLVIPPEDV